MADAISFMPLGSLEAAVFDTETTGLDARKARMIQIGAVTLAGGVIHPSLNFVALINPGQPIPPGSTAIHGITDGDVAGQPRFSVVYANFRQFVGSRLVIGHSLSYDFAVLREELRLAELLWVQPRFLDVRNLARVAAPGLADHSLDRLCEWLEISIEGRHTALGDARATAEAYLKIVPLLRERGIRTVAEAEAACRELAEQDARAAGGLMTVDVAPAGLPQDLVKLDVFAFRHRVSDVMSTPAVVLPGTSTVRDTIKLIMDAGLSSVFVALEGGASGIVTERDVLRAIMHEDASGLDLPISALAKSPLQAVFEDDHVYKAIGQWTRLGIRHLAVVNHEGVITGALTTRNLLRNRATTVIAIGDRIAAAESTEQLGQCWAEVPKMSANLLREDVDARTIASIISAEICAITKRAADLAEGEMVRGGLGGAPVPYTVLVLGSAGRDESLLAADQDNAIIYSSGGRDSAEDVWFAGMGTRMARILDEVGIVYCKGGVMAKTPEWRHSLGDWKDLVEHWVLRQRPQDLLNVDIFFDAVPVGGQVALGHALLEQASARAKSAPDFLMMLTELARKWHSPIGLLGGFEKSDGRLDLKKFGLMPIFTAARVLALRHGVQAKSSADRLRGVQARGIGAPDAIERIISAHEYLLKLVLLQQLADGRNGISLSPRIVVDKLDKAQKRRLKECFEAVEEVIDIVSEGRLI